jgi:hypothetical protein
VAGTGALTIEKRTLCSCDKQTLVTLEQAEQELCPACGQAFKDVGARPESIELYTRDVPRSRDVRWVLALHGMNTTGAWQEAFNWLVARTYKRSVPMAIYKYGIVRPGAILKFRQRALVKELGGRIHRLIGETKSSGFGGVPDIIAHSLGTWLLGHALQDDRSLKVGRVLLTGCILRPDFDWAALIERGQVEAVLCHTAGQDIWARVAHYIIPDSGPSGVRGFNDRDRIGHITLPRGHHSDFFDENRMPKLFKTIWQPFLTEPEGSEIRRSHLLPAPDWAAACWPFRATIFRIFVLALLAGIGLTAIAAFALGFAELWQLAS